MYFHLQEFHTLAEKIKNKFFIIDKFTGSTVSNEYPIKNGIRKNIQIVADIMIEYFVISLHLISKSPILNLKFKNIFILKDY